IQHSAVSAAQQGSVCAEYRFTHALYREIFYRRLPLAKRMRLHREVGERLERMYSGSPGQVAAELAAHFQAGGDCARAVRYLRLLAQRCAARHALPAALDALNNAMQLAGTLPHADRTIVQFELTEQRGLVYRLMGQLDSSAAEFARMCEGARQV